MESKFPGGESDTYLLDFSPGETCTCQGICGIFNLRFFSLTDTTKRLTIIRVVTIQLNNQVINYKAALIAPDC